ncbi:hypothetical protein LCGC14_0535530 [marine sediment metagenome]|uniref:HNH domain-containing protein n=1 Tax=marine sediment metagenome TaxID=412755 RepID=A0A0F9RYX4_9ZZZZ
MKWNGLKRVSNKQKKEVALRSKLKKELLEEQIAEHGFTFCMTCGGPGDWRGLSLSHIIPLSRGGKTERGNVIIECYPDHQRFEKKPELRGKI